MTDATSSGQPHKVDETLKQAEAPDVRFFLKEYGRPFALTLGLALLLALAWQIWQGRRARAEQDAGRLLLEGQAAAVAEQYPGTAAAPLAILMLNTDDLVRGQYENALKRAEEFVRTHAAHALRPVADLQRAAALESLGRGDEALQAYTALAAKPTFVLGPAVLGKARCHEIAGQEAAARAVYEEFIAAQPDNPWRDVAEHNLQDLNGGLRKPGPALSFTVADLLAAPTPDLNLAPAPTPAPEAPPPPVEAGAVPLPAPVPVPAAPVPEAPASPPAPVPATP